MRRPILHNQMKTPWVRTHVNMFCLMVIIGSADGFAQGLYEQGSKRVSVVAGVGQSFDDDYLILGAGVGYFVLNGLELGVNWQIWLVGDPTINQITPELTYVFRTRSIFDPYLGGMYRWTFISEYDDLAAWGGRAGVNIATGESSYVGIGAVFLDYVDCAESVYQSCSEVYPEFTFAFAF